MKTLEYIKNYYAIDCYIGQEVKFKHNNKLGVILKDRGHYVGVNFYGEKPQAVSNCHPEDLEYLGKGKIRKLTRSQKRYQDYIKSELDITFAEYIGVAK